MFSRGVVMIHDNNHLHTAIQNLITTFGLEQFDHPPYSPDLTPSDFHLLLHLKSFLAGWWLHKDKRSKKLLPHALHSRQDHPTMKGSKNWCSAMTMPQEWWKLCQKAVYSMHIKCHYAWFVIYSCFFLIAHRNLLSG